MCSTQPTNTQAFTPTARRTDRQHCPLNRKTRLTMICSELSSQIRSVALVTLLMTSATTSCASAMARTALSAVPKMFKQNRTVASNWSSLTGPRSRAASCRRQDGGSRWFTWGIGLALVVGSMAMRTISVCDDDKVLPCYCFSQLGEYARGTSSNFRTKRECIDDATCLSLYRLSGVASTHTHQHHLDPVLVQRSLALYRTTSHAYMRT
jgi:hypothetical protein